MVLPLLLEPFIYLLICNPLTIYIILLGFKYLASSIPICAFIGVAIGVGFIFGMLIFGISRNPSINETLIRWSFIGLALVEVAGFIGLVFSFLIIYALISLMS